MESSLLLPDIEDPDGAPFWEGAALGELRVQACGACGAWRMPPRPMCPKCRSTETSSAAKRPTANSYWRCLKCGDVWNPALLSDAPKQWWRR